MTKQPEALKLADILEFKIPSISCLEDASLELRRLHEVNVELFAALTSVRLWMENQADGQSKGGHATFDLMMLREQRDIAQVALNKATGETE
jgi:hypothetical protein